MSANLRPRVLVAGLGNIFYGDDAFGVEVARRLSSRALPEGVRVYDAGVRTMHLAYEIAEGGYDTVILVDLISRGSTPGTVYELEPEADEEDAKEAADAHDLRPHQLLAFARKLGARVGRVVIVGCEPACTNFECALSEPVSAAVDVAINAILELALSSTKDPMGVRV